MCGTASTCILCHSDARALDVPEPQVRIESAVTSVTSESPCFSGNSVSSTIRENGRDKWVGEGWQDRQFVIQISCALAGPA